MRIRVRPNKSGSVSWQVDYGIVDGKRRKESFKTQAEAELVVKDHEALKRKHGELGAQLNTRELAAAISAMERLEAVGASLHEAVDFFLRKGLKVKSPMEITAAVTGFTTDQVKAEKKERSLQTWKCSLVPFGAHFAGRKAHELTEPEIDVWLRGNAWAPRTVKNRLGDLRTFFAWAKRRGVIHDDPCMDLRSPKMVDGEIGTLSLAQCGELLAKARGGRLLAYVALGMFCGIRRAEQERMTWDAVKLEDGVVIVGGALSKTRSRRVVDISENALAWLRLVKLEPGDRIAPWDFKERFIKLRKEAKIATWPNNALRHTFASMHYAMHQNEHRLQAQMGHESAAMLHRHYRALKTRVEAEAFWQLMPAAP